MGVVADKAIGQGNGAHPASMAVPAARQLEAGAEQAAARPIFSRH